MMNKKVLEFLCKKTQKDLKRHLKKQLKAKYETVISEDGFLFAKGTFPVLLVAHMDTVHKELPKKIVYADGKMSSPQGIGGDDRCGCYMIGEIIKNFDCSVLFCEDEESGMIGAGKFVDFVKDMKSSEEEHDEADIKNVYGITSKDLQFNYIIELDRKGSEDAVFYDCDNPEFEEFITESGDWKSAWGSFSDISEVAPALGAAAVNLSCGYYNAHTTNEYIVLDELEESILKTMRLLEKTKPENKFEYIEKTYYGRGGWTYDDYYGNYNYGRDSFGQRTYGKSYDSYKNTYIIMFRGEDGYMDWEDIYANSKYEAIGMFLYDHRNLTYDDIEVECYEYESSSTNVVPYRYW